MSDRKRRRTYSKTADSAIGVKKTQVFTPKWVTNEMLDMLDQDLFHDESTYFFEPSCGDGQMLEVIVERIYKALLKKYEGDACKALADTCFKFYAIEIDPELVPKARMRIFELIARSIPEGFDFQTFSTYLIARLLHEKIECKDFFKFMEKGFTPSEIRGVLK